MAKVAGSIWVEGNNLHFVDQYNREWQCPGRLAKAVSGAKAGSIWVDPTNAWLYFVNEAGTEIYWPYPYGDALVPINSQAGSLWVAQDNQLHWLAGPWTNDPVNYRLNVRSHYDQATVNTHTDTHSDTPHTDSVHNDAHTDVPAVSTHDDWHIDDPHHDFNDQFNDYFTDGGQAFNDFSDHIDYYHPQWGHGDAPAGGYDVHGDYGTPTFHEDYYHRDFGASSQPPNSRHDDFWNHNDVPHGDNPHHDSHTDRPHWDEATEYFHGDHWDSTVHQDVPHSDTPHGDGHSDAHTDTHGDSPHIDEPILIGP